MFVLILGGMGLLELYVLADVRNRNGVQKRWGLDMRNSNPRLYEEWRRMTLVGWWCGERDAIGDEVGQWDVSPLFQKALCS